MTPEENRKRDEDGHVRFLKEHICDKNSDAPFVFISYKSDDWKAVLHDVVYTLVKDYGLNVYFDGSFDSHNSLWISQFPENMEDYKCKGILSFFDNKYATSYATLLELMYSQTLAANRGLKVVPINLEKLTKIDGPLGAEDTGLGVEQYEDETRNVNAKAEKELFTEVFEELKEREILKTSKFIYKGKKLTKKICSEITAEIIAYLRINENYYEEGKSLDGIVNSIKDACGEEVFNRAPDYGEAKAQELPGCERIEVQEIHKEPPVELSNEEKEKKRKASGTYDFVLYGIEYRDMLLKNMMLTVFEEIMNRHAGKTDELLASLKCLAKGNVISKDARPTTFRAGKAAVIGGREISIGTSLDSKAVLNYINKLIYLCGEPRHIFKLSENEKPEGGAENTAEEEKDGAGSGVAAGNVEPEEKAGLRGRRASGTYNFVLYGERYEDVILKNLMLTVFEEVMKRHVDKREQLLSSLKCLAEGNAISKDARPTVFRAGKVVNIGGKEISIGTSLDSVSVLAYIKKLMEICGESRKNLVIEDYEY